MDEQALDPGQVPAGTGDGAVLLHNGLKVLLVLGDGGQVVGGQQGVLLGDVGGIVEPPAFRGERGQGVPPVRLAVGAVSGGVGVPEGGGGVPSCWRMDSSALAVAWKVMGRSCSMEPYRQP